MADLGAGQDPARYIRRRWGNSDGRWCGLPQPGSIPPMKPSSTTRRRSSRTASIRRLRFTRHRSAAIGQGSTGPFRPWSLEIESWPYGPARRSATRRHRRRPSARWWPQSADHRRGPCPPVPPQQRANISADGNRRVQVVKPRVDRHRDDCSGAQPPDIVSRQDAASKPDAPTRR